MKTAICTGVGVVGTVIANALGGWDAALSTLCIFMLVDYLTGVIVAAVFHKSKKTETGSLKSWEGFKGLCRKGMILLLVLIGARLDMVIGVDYVRNGVIFGFLANEGISILENAGLMGIPLPAGLTNAIEVLKKKSTDINIK